MKGYGLNDFSSKEFKNTTRNHKIVKYLLSKIEIYEHNNEIDIDSDLFTIEHILPENADEAWGDFSSDEINRSRFRIGNLTLLEKRLNREAAQKSYSEKCKIFEKSHSKLTNLIPTKFGNWNEEKIAKRQRDLAKQAKAIWKIHELSN